LLYNVLNKNMSLRERCWKL